MVVLEIVAVLRRIFILTLIATFLKNLRNYRDPIVPVGSSVELAPVPVSMLVQPNRAEPNQREVLPVLKYLFGPSTCSKVYD